MKLARLSVLAMGVAVALGSVIARGEPGGGAGGEEGMRGASDLPRVFESTVAAWKIRLPAGWREMPTDMFDESKKEAEGLKDQWGLAGEVPECGFVGGQEGDRRYRWGFVTVKKLPSGIALPADLTPFLDLRNDRDVQRLTKNVAKFKVLGNTIDAAAGRATLDTETTVGEGDEAIPVRSRAFVVVGGRSVVTLVVHCLSESWEANESEFDELGRSLAFQPWADLSTAQRASVSGGRGGSKAAARERLADGIASMAFTFGLILLVGVWVFKKRSRPTG